MKKPIYYLILFLMMMWAGTLSAQDSVAMNISPDWGCEPLYVNASNMSSFTDYLGTVKYEWFVDGMLVSTDPSFFDTTFTETRRYNITLEARDSVGELRGRDEQQVDVRGVTQFEISPSEYVCPDEPVDVDFHYDGEIYSFEWDFSNNDIRYDNHQTIAYDSTGIYYIQLYIETDCGTNTISQEVFVTDTMPPKPEIYTSGDRFCPGDPIEFETSYKDYEVEWDMGDGTILHDPKAEHVFSDLGAYAVSATVTNSCGLSGTVTDTIFIEDGVEAWADFDYQPEQGDNCPGSPIRFNAQSAGFLHWNFGDGTSSNETSPLHFYSDSGFYNVELIVTNSCGNSDTSYQEVMIEYRDWEYIGYDPYISFERDYSSSYSDTLRLCPGEIFEANTHGGDDSEYIWNLGDGTTMSSDIIEYAYTENGLYELTLSISDQCHRYSNPAMRWIVVDQMMEPVVQLNYAPKELCPGEQVYFWDEGWWEDETDNVYDIDFGDGASQNNITEISDHPLQVLAYHNYASVGGYEFTFSATNICGNTVSLIDSIYVTTDASKEPFYHVSNSTSDDEGDGDGKMEMWNMPTDSTDHEFIIDVQWSDWSQAMNDTFYIYAWYGGFNPDDESGDPAGMAMYTSSNINIGDTFRIYVPVNEYAPPEVGFAVGWYCEPDKMDDEPDSWGTLMDDMGTPISSLPLYEYGVTTTSDFSMGAPLQLSPWNGICRSSSIEGSWRGYANGKVVFLSLYEDSMMYSYNLEIADDEMWTNSEYITGGQYEQTTETDLMLYPNSGPCSVTAAYTIEQMEDGMLLRLVSDICSEQSMYLDTVMFYHDEYDDDKGDDKDKEPACPGDPVKFEIAGGSSYIWYFGDGESSTEQFPLHSYDTAGIYQAMVIATNSCGRTDTLFTQVEVADNIMPYAYFNIDPWDIKAGDTVYFMPEIYKNETAEFYDYLWDFGDSTSATNMIPMHVYYAPGPYQVTLTVENGCGFSEESMELYVQEAYGGCDVDARFDFEIESLTVNFHNFSWGDSLLVFWEFGDDEYSDEWEPVHEYTEPGVYNVCLSVYDVFQDCASNVCIEIVVGELDCYADFTYTINNSTNTVRFYNQSSNANAWYWDFGDYNIGFEPNPVHVYPEAGWYWVSLAIEDTMSGCFDYRGKEIWVGEIDTAESCFITWDYFIDSMNVTFNTEVTGNISDGFWDFGDGSFGYEPNISHTYEEAGNYYVCAYVFDSLSGCQAEKCEEIRIGQDICEAEFVYIIDSNSFAVEFIDQSNGTFTDIYMEYGDGTYSLTIDTIHSYPGPGEYWACLIVYNDSTDCYDEVCKQIRIRGEMEEAICEASFTYIPIQGSLDVQFRENSTTEFNNWYWYFDDGNYSITQNPVHTYSEPGVYEVCMAAYNDSTDCFDELCRIVTIEGNELTPSVTASFDIIVNQIEGDAHFRNTSSGEFTHAYWIFGDGDAAEAIDTITHGFEPGLYQACLIVTNAETGETDEMCDFVIIGEQPCLITADYNYFIDADNNEIRLSDASVGTPNSWFWSFGDGSTSAQASPVKQYDEAGYYLISLAVRDTITGCSDFTSYLIQIGSGDCLADFDYSVNPTTREVSFTNTSIGSPSYFYWLLSDGGTSEEENPEYTFDESGIYGVGLAITGNGGLCNSFTTKTIQVGSVDCNADFQIYVDSASNTAYFDAEIIGEASNLVWNFGDGGIAQGMNTSHVYEAPGFYTVGLNTYNNENGCMDYIDKTVLIGQSDIDVEPDFFYRVDESTRTVDFVDNSIGNVAVYTWDFGDGNTSTEQNPTYSFAESGYYNVCLTVETAGGVTNTKCERIRVSNTETECLAQFIFNVDSAAKEATFTDLSIGTPDSWSWNFNDGQTATTQNPVMTFDTAGLYRVEFDIANSTTGCSSSAFGVINVAKGATGLIAAFIYDVDTSLAKAGIYPVDLVAYPSNSAANYEWDLDDGYTYSGATEFTHIYTEQGEYNVCFTVSDDVTGESATDCQLVSTTTGTTNPPSTNGLKNVENLTTNLTAYPNPFTEYTRIKYTLEKANEIELDVYDETGRHVSNIIRNYKEAGTHTLYWDSDILESGVYVIQLKDKNGSMLKHLCIVKQ